MLALHPPVGGPEPALAPGPIAQAPVTRAEPAGPAMVAPAFAAPAVAQAPVEAPPPPEAEPSPEARSLMESGDGEPCSRDAVPAPLRNRCLYDTIRTSEQALEAEVANALRVIDARSDLAPVQRNRWKGLLDEAQSRFLLYRNFDCQSVAPFEGRRGIGNFEERALCLITANTRRAEALAARYVLPPEDAAKAMPDGPSPHPGTWTHPTPALLD